MKNSESSADYGGIRSEAVKAKTGKGWPEWLALLDDVGAHGWSHPEIARFLLEKCGCTQWWSQMVTVGYEQARGLRVKHQQSTGFTANISKTMPIPLGTLYRHWNDRRARAKWLPESPKMTVGKATENKRIRFTWVDGHTSLEVNFLEKGTAKSQVSVQHSKLASVEEVGRMKAFWKEALQRLQDEAAAPGKEKPKTKPKGGVRAS